MRMAVLLLAMLTTCSWAAELIGSVIPPYPDGLTHRQGACIAHSRGFANICDYSIGILESPDGQPKLLFAGRLTGRVEAKKAIWTITDVMPYPVLPANYFLAVATCRIDGKDDSTIMAAVRVTESEWFNDVLWAYRFDMTNEKFEKFKVTGVECYNESWGAD